MIIGADGCGSEALTLALGRQLGVVLPKPPHSAASGARPLLGTVHRVRLCRGSVYARHSLVHGPLRAQRERSRHRRRQSPGYLSAPYAAARAYGTVSMHIKIASQHIGHSWRAILDRVIGIRRPARNVMTDCKTIADCRDRLDCVPNNGPHESIRDFPARLVRPGGMARRHVTQRAFASRVISGSGVGMECAHFSRASNAQPAKTPRCITRPRLDASRAPPRSGSVRATSPHRTCGEGRAPW